MLFTRGNAALIGNLIIVAAIVLVLASITYALVEKPAMNLRGRLPPKRTIELAPSPSDRGPQAGVDPVLSPSGVHADPASTPDSGSADSGFLS